VYPGDSEDMHHLQKSFFNEGFHLASAGAYKTIYPKSKGYFRRRRRRGRKESVCGMIFLKLSNDYLEDL
jgi:hypothetical protein